MLTDALMGMQRRISFHTPSENRINGKQFPLEAQLLHTVTNTQLPALQ